MGSGRFDPNEWRSYTTTRGYSHKTTAGTHGIYSASEMDKDLDPKGVKIRESRDSVDNPVSNAIIVALDVTGSMLPVLDAVAREGLKTLFEHIYNRKPVTDPHVMFMGLGDANCDDAPLQVSQFEADIRIAKQLEKMWLEKGGGGNMFESYDLPWYFAACHTSIDCWEKRGKKGYLFTIGDEEPSPMLYSKHVLEFIGDEVAEDLSTDTVLSMVNKMYNVFHVMVERGTNYTPHVPKKWKNLIGQRALPLSDHTKLSEVIVSAIQVAEGHSVKEVVESWTGDTSLVVAHAMENMLPSVKGKSSKKTSVVRL